MLFRSATHSKHGGYFNDGMTQYSKENCDRAVEIMDTLIEDLSKVGLRAKENIKIELI